MSEKQNQPRAEDARLAVLISDYEMAREDERTLVNTQATVFSAAITLVGLLAAVVTQNPHVPELVFAAAPLIPYALFTHLTIIGLSATIRSYYVRGLEYELQRYAAEPLSHLGNVLPASFVGITIEATSLRWGRGRRSYRWLNLVLVAIILLVFGGLTWLIATKVSFYVRVAMVTVYVPAICLLGYQAMVNTVGGRGLFIAVANSYLAHRSRLPNAWGNQSHVMRTERSLASYLLLPRPADCVKWLISPLVFVISCAVTGDWGSSGRFVLVWLVLEYLLYEARYQWNDIRGVQDDAQHAERRFRGRLPLGDSPRDVLSNIRVSIAVMLVRVCAAIALGVVLRLGIVCLSMFVAVFGVGTIYEALRQKASSSSPAHSRHATPLLWLTVGLGYVLRGEVGFVSAGAATSIPHVLTSVLFLWALGVMFVLMTWALEATSFGVIQETAGRRRWLMAPALMRKQHIARLLPYIGIQPIVADVSLDRRTLEAYGGRVRVLMAPVSLQAPWNLAFYTGAAASGALGYLLAAAADDASWNLTVGSAVVGFLVALMLALANNIRWQLLLAFAGAVLLTTIAWFRATPEFIVIAAGAPWFAIAVTYVLFRNSSYGDLNSLGDTVRALRKALPAACLRASRVFVGSHTWEYLTQVQPATVHDGSVTSQLDDTRTDRTRNDHVDEGASRDLT
jgi:4-hydroxybenzoate polyprenyltransferase